MTRELRELVERAAAVLRAEGATHVPPPNAWVLEVSVPWFRWKLLGDNAACEAFKKLPDSSMWELREEQNVAPCE